MSEPNIIQVLIEASGIPDGDDMTTIAASLGQACNGNLEHRALWRRALDGILAGTAGPSRQPTPPEFSRRRENLKPGPTPSIFSGRRR